MHAHLNPVELTLIAAWAFSAIVSGMPPKTDKSSTGYVWAYNSLHLAAARLDKLQADVNQSRVVNNMTEKETK